MKEYKKTKIPKYDIDINNLCLEQVISLDIAKSIYDKYSEYYLHVLTTNFINAFCFFDKVIQTELSLYPIENTENAVLFYKCNITTLKAYLYFNIEQYFIIRNIKDQINVPLTHDYFTAKEIFNELY